MSIFTDDPPAIDRAYRFVGSEALPPQRLLAFGDEDGTCRAATTADRPPFLGISRGHCHPGRLITVRRYGIALVESAGPIPRGARLSIADDEGRIGVLPHPIYTANDEEEQPALRIEWKQPAGFSVLSTIQITGDAPFGGSIEAGAIRLSISDESRTAAALKSLIEGDAMLASLLRVTILGSLLGTQSIPPQQLVCSNLHQLTTPLGVAEETSHVAGDRIRILLNPF